MSDIMPVSELEKNAERRTSKPSIKNRDPVDNDSKKNSVCSYKIYWTTSLVPRKPMLRITKAMIHKRAKRIPLNLELLYPM